MRTQDELNMKAYIQTYGCQMNEHDSERMAQVLEELGYAPTDDIEQAALILVNTCSVRRNPENKVYSFLGTLRRLKALRPELIIAVAGCVAQQEGQRILDRAPHVDLVFGPDHCFALPELLEAVRRGERIVQTNWAPCEGSVQDFVPPERAACPPAAPCKGYIAIMKGCNNFCSYCIVPYTRGREASRPPGSILAEARAMAAQGVREVWLLGQNVNSYRAEGWDFLRLLEAICDLDIPRIRFTSPHPKDWRDELAALMAARPNLCNYVHLPFQAGADRILALMNRRHAIADYLGKAARLRAAVPGIEISADVIVGFPSETEAEFQQTLDVLREVRFSQLFSFMYSPRPGTKAAELEDDVPRAEKQDRLRRLIALQEALDAEALAAYVGTEHEVLVDGAHPKQPGVFSGRTGGYRPVSLEGPGLALGQILPVRITGFHGHWLDGAPIPPESAP